MTTQNCDKAGVSVNVVKESYMKRSYAVSVFVALCTLIIPFGVYAAVTSVDAPHAGVVSSYSCSTCHTNHLTLGSDATAFNNICQTCHRVGDPAAGTKPIASADAANPYKNHTTYGIRKFNQTSHRWDGLDTVPMAGALPPIQPAMTSITSRTYNQMACTRCHNQHDNSNGKFLRMSNAADALCMDCHRTRNVQSHTSGSHPVNVAIPSTSAFSMNNANPANPTSDLSQKLSGGKVVCTTCHGVHFTDSRSSTFDGFSSSDGRGRNFINLSTGDGYLLRTDLRGGQVLNGHADKINICTNCHAGKRNHNLKDQDIQCADCHSAHVEYDPKDPSNTKGTNVYLIKRAMSKNNQATTVLFRYTSLAKREYKNANGTGVCQGCHDVPSAAPGLNYPIEHNVVIGTGKDCVGCHAHNNATSSFSGGCNVCHGHPPKDNTIGTSTGLATPATNAAGSAGAHVVHATGLKMNCSTCHYGYASRTMPNYTIDIGFGIDSNNFGSITSANMKYNGFKSVSYAGTYGNTNVLGTAPNGSRYTFTGADTSGVTANQTCANVYCHGATLTNGVNTTPNWTLSGGSQAGCGTCHGAYMEGPGTGGHTRHAGNAAGGLQMSCDNCHGTLPVVSANGFWLGANHVNGVTNWDVTALSAPQGGSAATYTANNGIPVTIGATNVLAPSSTYGTCGNVYCHSSVQGAGGSGLPTSFASPVWGGSSLTCGSCHVNMASDPAATGSHVRHAQTYSIACASCHSGYTATTTDASRHANYNVDLIFPTGIAYGTKYNGGNSTKLPGAGYASCTVNYCHSNSGPNGSTRIYPSSAPVWGGSSLGCGGCHADMANILSSAPNGGHYKHASSANSSGPDYDCSVCHTGYTATTVTIATHVNQTVEFNKAVTGYSKTSPSTAGVAWGTCSTNVCHGQATGLSWNNGSIWQTNSDHCSTCHSSALSVTSSGTFYSTSYPSKQTSNTDTHVGAHAAHLNTLSLSSGVSCDDCHGVVTLKGATHMNGTTNFNWNSLVTRNGALSPSISSGVCSNMYCHGAKMPDGDDSGSNKTPTWHVPFLPGSLTIPGSCNTCHGFPPKTTVTHTSIHPDVAADLGVCAGCHPNVNGSATTYAGVFKDRSLHVNGVVDVSGAGGCSGCHGYPPANKRFVGTHNNWSGARAENYSGAGGSHTVAAHVPRTASPSDGFANCTNCHNATDHSMGAGFDSVKNIKVRIDPRNRFSNIAPQAKYSSNGLNGSQHVTGKCTNVACHFQRTPRW